jgi:hypothetical protein
MTPDVARAKLASIHAEIDAAQENLKDYRKAVASKLHPHKIGDKIVVDGKRAYSHVGKSFVADHVTVKSKWGSVYRFYASGPIIKKDGTLGAQRGEWWGEQI